MRFKKIIIVILIAVLIPFMASCALPHFKFPISGIAFDSYKTIEIENERYEIYKISDEQYLTIDELNSAFLYNYQEIKKPSCIQWTINYFEYNEYLQTNNLDTIILNQFYNSIKPLLDNYQSNLSFAFDLYQHNEYLEKEFTIENIYEYNNIYLIDMYIPFQIVNLNSNIEYLIYIPVKTFLCYRINESMKLVLDSEHVINTTYYDFVNSANVLEKQ